MKNFTLKHNSGFSIVEAIAAFGLFGYMVVVAGQLVNNQILSIKLASVRGDRLDLRKSLVNSFSCEETLKRVPTCSKDIMQVYDHLGRQIAGNKWQDHNVRFSCRQVSAGKRHYYFSSKHKSEKQYIDLTNGVPTVCLQKSEDCLFAVSGTFMGIAYYGGRNGSTFPHPRSGNNIDHGEVFDATGGIYLAANSRPYVYGYGYIDQAVKSTFDSIAIPEGMRAEIRNASGRVIFQADGPVIGHSLAYGMTATRYIQLLRSTPQASLPQWMQDYAASQSQAQGITDLHNARSVLVSATPGGRCDF